jgi:two-component system, sensor histidine kinase and response regulator
MNGSVVVQSEVGKGSTFSFNLLLRKGCDENTMSQLPAADLSNLRVLIIDPCTIVQNIFCKYVTFWKMSSDIASTADEGFMMLKREQKKGTPYHFAIIENDLPEYSGIELGIHLFLIVKASTSTGISDDALHKLGFSGILNDTIHPDQFEIMLKLLRSRECDVGFNHKFVTRHLLNNMKCNAIGQQAININEFSQVRVLVVEDMKVNQILIVKILQKHGCHVDVASNGCEAVDMLRSLNYNIIFMDCQMPEMDGFEATKVIRQEERDKRNIIVALTADAMSGDREKCLNIGMDDYLNKPIKQEQITGILRKWLATNPAPVQASSADI